MACEKKGRRRYERQKDLGRKLAMGQLLPVLLPNFLQEYGAIVPFDYLRL